MAQTIDQYLESVPPDKRAALEQLRKTILAAAPDAEECVTYGVPAFRLNGKAFIGFGAARNHCSLFPMSGAAVEKFKAELEGFETSKGTIRFKPEKAIPATLVRKIVKWRVSEVLSKTR
ncbi:MAG: hypothetical protein FJW39_21855 [Acidobacteria bacterium]|nr:hypothetical protein [Acidobacteriota bacterium]